MKSTFLYKNLRATYDLTEVYPEKGLYLPKKFIVEAQNYGLSFRKFGDFTLAPMPGCCGIVVSTESFVIPEERSKFSKEFHALKCLAATKLGYSLLFATTQLSNIPELIGACNSDWKVVHTFKNSRTGRELGVLVKNLFPSSYSNRERGPEIW